MIVKVGDIVEWNEDCGFHNKEVLHKGKVIHINCNESNEIHILPKECNGKKPDRNHFAGERCNRHPMINDFAAGSWQINVRDIITNDLKAVNGCDCGGTFLGIPHYRWCSTKK